MSKIIKGILLFIKRILDKLKIFFVIIGILTCITDFASVVMQWLLLIICYYYAIDVIREIYRSLKEEANNDSE